MEFTKEVNCQTCKYGYFAGFSMDGWHNLCGSGRCYLCAERDDECDWYEQGDVPEGKTRDL